MSRPDSQPGFPCSYGKYQLLARIGQGGMADIFRARLPGVAGFEKILVIKRLLPHLAQQPSMVQMFVNEAKLAAQVQHRNVVQVFELGQLENGEYFMAMEHIAGTDLRQILRVAAGSGMRVPPWFSVHLVSEVLDGLSFVHAMRDESGRTRNVVHRDVTPANIFVSYLGDIKLGDFGVAKDENRAENDKTRVGQLKGKIPYMSPEQLYGRELDGRTDVFAAAVVLWECLAQRRLFGGRPDIEAMNLICFGQRERPSRFVADIPKELDDIVLRALDPDPDRRTRSAEALQAELLEVLPRLRSRVLPTDVRSIVEVVLGNKDPSVTTGPRPLVDNTQTSGPNFTERTPSATPPDHPYPRFPPPVRGFSPPQVPKQFAIERLPSPAISAFLEENNEDKIVTDDLPRDLLKSYDGPHPFWVSTHDGKRQGPLSAKEALYLLKKEAQGGFIEHSTISATGKRWMDGPSFAVLSGQELLVDPHAEVEKELPKSPLSGRLERVSPTALFGRLARDRVTGRLVVSNGAARREVMLLEGRPTFVYANGPALQIPELLVDKNIVRRDLIGEILHGVVLEARPIEEVVARRVGADISRYYGAFMKERIADLFSWTQGAFAIDLQTPISHSTPFASSLLTLLPDLIARAKSNDELFEALLPWMDLHLERTDRFHRMLADMKLSDTQLQTMMLFGGKTLAASLKSAREEKLALTSGYILLQCELLIPA